VRFTVDAYPDETFTGTIRQIRLQPETIQNVVNYTVVIDAANDSEVLLPGMTATVDFIIEQRQGVLLIANAALQFQPTKKMLSGTRPDPQNRRSMSNDSTDERLADFQHDTLTQSNSPSAGAPVDLAILWYLDKEKRLRALPVRIGVSDGKNTEIIEARGLKEGMEFVNGTTERGASANNTSNTRQQNRMPGPPPMF
jgi:HlyD family secretion protein